jgi:hypothetical protein
MILESAIGKLGNLIKVVKFDCKLISQFPNSTFPNYIIPPTVVMLY